MEAVDLGDPGRQRFQMRPFDGEQFAGHGADVFLICAVDTIAPLAGLEIQVVPAGEGPAGQEVALDEVERPLHASGAIGVAALMSDEAEAEARMRLEMYKTFLEKYLAIPTIVGRKSENEKFAGALRTYTFETMTQDKKALQSGTSHNLGQNFSKVFNVKFLDIPLPKPVKYRILPLHFIDPSSGVYTPATNLSSVLLPLPLFPIIPTTSPSLISRLILSKTFLTFLDRLLNIEIISGNNPLSAFGSALNTFETPFIEILLIFLVIL